MWDTRVVALQGTADLSISLACAPASIKMTNGRGGLARDDFGVQIFGVFTHGFARDGAPASGDEDWLEAVTLTIRLLRFHYGRG
jgi:hypothetical protein